MKKRSRSSQRPSQNAYQLLEPRQLLAGIFYDASTGIITVEGSELSDRVEVNWISASQIEVDFANVDQQNFEWSTASLLVFNGYAGDDRLENNTSVPTLAYGGPGQDVLVGGTAADRLLGGPGADQLKGRNGDDQLFGGDGPDELEGGHGHDQLFGNEGDDKLWGGTGNDLILGHAGDDLAFGNQGHDQLYGDLGSDTLVGDEGADTLVGGDQDDILFGGAGTDRILGQAGADWISGGDFSDSLFGGDGDDRILGQEGDDRIWGGSGNDQLDGDEGNDVLLGESGNDTLSGGDGDDLLLGNEDDDLLRGGAQDDILLGHEGNDVLIGDDDRDRLFGNLGDDLLSGGEGDDALFGNQGDDQLSGGDDDDLLLGHDGRDQLLGEDGDDSLYGGADNDTLDGGAGNDRLFGQDADDTVRGGPGNDILFGNAGADLLDGGLNDDDIYATAEDTVVDDDDDTDESRADAIGRPFAQTHQITVSFAPEGTPILEHSSQLFSAFAGVLTAEQIQNSVMLGLQSWAQHGNLDVGLVSDSGDAFGTPGKSYGDPRFGDIRIGAIPLPGDTRALAIGQGDFVAGTWAGEILFNSLANFNDVEDFMAVALHEAGHALGLKHTEDIGSAMHRFSNRLEPSASDIANFQALYGIRSLDGNDDDTRSNDSLQEATQLGFHANDHGNGTLPAMAWGDISDPNDLDFYEIRIPDDYNGPLRVGVISNGISQLAMQVTLFDEAGSQIDSGASGQAWGDTVTVTADVQAGDRFFVRVAGLAPNAVGGYALAATLDTRNTLDDASILAAAQSRTARNLEAEALANFLQDPANYLVNEDAHSDDDQAGATELNTEAGFELNARFEYQASLLDAQDRDFYRFEAAEGMPAGAAMNISVRSLEFLGMTPRVTLFDELGQELVTEMIVNGQGEVVVQLPNYEPGKEYRVAVESDDILDFQDGNYELVISYAPGNLELTPLASGALSSTGKSYHSVHVAQSQIFQFALEADPAAGGVAASLWATIYDTTGNVVYQTATRAGERRTSKPVLLQPGSYVIEIEAGSGASFDNLGYQLLGIDIGNSQGPKFSDPTNSPFEQDSEGAYQYPDNVVSVETFVVTDGISSNQSDPPADDPPSSFFDWYWGLLGA